MKNLALPRIKKMSPYSPPLDGRSSYDGTLLDFNERAAMSPSALRGLERCIQDKKLHLYPEYFDLAECIAKYAAVDPAQVMLANGTDQAIDVIFRTFADAGDTVIIPTPTFAMYEQYAQAAGNKIIKPLYVKSSLAFPLQQVLDAIDESVRAVVVTNPNSPTGTLVPLLDIEKIARKAANAIVYVDEAYFEFARVTATTLIKTYPNIIVSRTFSKAFGLAGLRIGYIIADSQYICEMLKVRGPYDVNMPAYYVAAAALTDLDGVRRYVDEVINEAKPFTETYFSDNKITFWPSAGNFILFKPKNPNAVEEALRQNGVLVRPQSKTNIEGTLRVTIGTLQQMKTFTKTYTQVIREEKLKPQKYALLDRDGTLIFEPQDTYQIDSLAKLRILDGVVEGLQALSKSGYRLLMITNQDGLGTPAFPGNDFEAPQQALLSTLAQAGVTFENIFICPHLPEERCACRKPKTGLLDDFLRLHTIDMAGSFVCGDRESDKGLAENVGLKFVPMETNENFYTAIASVLPNERLTR